MSNLPAWKNVVSGGLDPNGTPYYAPNNLIDFVALITSGGGGGGGTATTALTASYVDIRGNGIIVNYGTGFISLTGSGGPSSISASYASTASIAYYAQTASYVLLAQTAVSASHSLASDFAQTASYSLLASTASYVKLLGNKIIVNHTYQGIELTGSDIVATASYVQLNYGPGIIPDPITPMAFSASVRSVNGIFPTNGNINTALVGVTTGTSASLFLSSSGDITASLNEGEVWVISNDPTASNNGRSFIYDEDNITGVGTWYELAPTDLATMDARYLKLDGGNSPLQGNVNLGGYDLTNGDLIGTSSWSISSSNAVSASYAGTASQAITASHINVTGSNVLVNWFGSQLQLTGSGDAKVIISASTPGTKDAGALWFNTMDGNTYIQYSDPTGNVWIPATTNVGQAFSASYADNARSASFAQTASVAGLAATASVAGGALTASFALTVAPKSAFLWAAPMGNPSVVGGTLLNNATYLNATAGVRLTQAVGGQFGTVNFNASSFDFTKDFRVSITTFAGTVVSPAVTGDGVWIGIGGNAANISRQAIGAQAFSWWSSTYPGTPGQYIYYNGSTVISDTAEMGLTGSWGTNILESRTNTLGTRTITGFVNGNYRISYTGTQPFGGTWITIGASTGGAWAEHYVRYICVEYI